MVGDSLFGFLADAGGVFMGFYLGDEAGKRFAGFKRFAVLFCEAVFIDGGNVRFGAIANVLVESIFWIFGCKVYHIAVAGNFGDDGSGGNFADFGVGLDDGRGIGFEGGVFEEINFTVDDDLGERSAF